MTRMENGIIGQPSIVLLKASDGTREGWLLIRMDEFLEQLDLAAWNADEALIGTVLPVGVAAVAERWAN